MNVQSFFIVAISVFVTTVVGINSNRSDFSPEILSHHKRVETHLHHHHHEKTEKSLPKESKPTENNNTEVIATDTKAS